jgi:polar amino acid transport system substrate-binding protein
VLRGGIEKRITGGETMEKQKRGGPFKATRRSVLKVGALGLGSLLVPGVVGTRKAAAATPQEPTIERIKRTGAFNLGCREADPPYGYLDKNKHVGFSTEIAEKVYERVQKELKTSLKINYIAVTGRTRIPLLLNNTIDIEAGATVITKQREKVVDFSIPFFLTATYVLLSADSPIRKVADLSGKRIGGHRGGLEEILYTKKLQQAGVFKTPVKFIGFENHSEGFTALQGGSIDAYSSDGPLLYGLQVKAPDPNKWRVFDPGVNAFAQAFPMRENSSDFAYLMNTTIVEMCENGQWEELYKKYFVPVGLPKELDDTLKFLVRINSWPD